MNTDIQIRPNTPDSCPLLWEKADEAEQPELRIMHGFTPKWFRQNMGLDYLEPWHEDPVLRRASLVQMKKTLNEHFPTLQLGGADPEAIGGTLSVAYGTTLVSGLFDLPIHFMEDNWPATQPGEMPDEVAQALTPPDLDNHPFFQRIMAQMDAVEQQWGGIEGVMNFQGVLNNAFRIRGQSIFTDMILDTALAQHLFDVVCETMITFIHRLYDRQAQSGVVKNFFVTSNCVVNMVSGEMYEQLLLPYDKKLAEAFEFFGIHNCAWCVDAYLDGYREIEKVGYLDFGLDSDLEKIAALFPQTRRCLMYSPVELKGKSDEQLKEDLRKIHDILTPCEIIITDIEDDTPDQRVLDFYHFAADIWQLAPQDLTPKTMSR